MVSTPLFRGGNESSILSWGISTYIPILFFYMKGIRSFYNVINLCISNKGNPVFIPKGVSSLVLQVFLILKKKGFIQTFQKEPKSGRILFQMFPHVKVRLVSTPSRRVQMNHSLLLESMKKQDQSLVYILSTPKGILSSEEACRQGVGGLLLCSARL